MASARRWSTIAVVIIAVVVGAGIVPVGAAVSTRPAYADEPVAGVDSTANRYQVTFVARSCASFSQIMAGRGRDDGIEAAAAPGRESGYTDGRPVDPDVEGGAGAGCDPLTGWRFTLGSGHQRTGALSGVTGVLGEIGPTVASVPRLDAVGQPGSATVAGAVTAVLTDDQVAKAMHRGLWVQGGRPGDPLLGDAKLGFGALRCAVDGRSGGNVQWLGFPSGIRHVFCYAYYVRGDTAGGASGAPATGTIVVKARLTRPVGYPQRFGFTTSFGYQAAGRFTLTSAGDGAEASFVRLANGDQQQIVGEVPPGWRLAGLSCAAVRSGGVATGTSVVDVPAGRAELRLGARETTTCVYTYEPPAVPAGLSVMVFSAGGGGTFGVSVGGASTGASWSLTASPAGDGSASRATGGDLTAIGPGTYTLTVTPPTGQGGGAWQLAGVNCSGAELTPNGLSVAVPVTTGAPLGCVLRVTRPVAALRLRVITTGGVASAGFAVAPFAGAGAGAGASASATDDSAGGQAVSAATGWSMVATTAASGHASDASGDLPGTLPAGGYLVTALAPRTTVDGGWKLSAFDCGSSEASQASIMEPDQDGERPPGPLIVTLRPGAATSVCTATWRFVRSTQLQIVLRAEGQPAARDGSAVVEVSCVDGSTGRVVLGAADDSPEGDLPSPLTFLAATSCTITLAETGTSHGRSVTVATVDPAQATASPALPTTVRLGRDVALYTVTIVETFEGTSASPSVASPFRTFQAMPVVLLGAGLVGVGILVLLIIVVRWRSGSRLAEENSAG